MNHVESRKIEHLFQQNSCFHFTQITGSTNAFCWVGRKFIWVFPYTVTEKPKWPFWPIQDHVNLLVILETSLSDDVFVTTQPSLWSNSQVRICLLERKTIALTIWTFVSKMMSLLFNTLSRFVIAFLPRSKHLLISWLWLPSAVILEPQKIKSVIVSTFFPSG